MNNREELIAKLKALQAERNKEDRHMKADELLLDYINDPEISQAFLALEKWYS